MSIETMVIFTLRVPLYSNRILLRCSIKYINGTIPYKNEKSATLSYRIFRRMHRVLNIDKNKN